MYILELKNLHYIPLQNFFLTHIEALLVCLNLLNVRTLNVKNLSICKNLPSYSFIPDELIGVEVDEFLETPVSDGTIEENFEEAFGLPSLVPEALGDITSTSEVDDFNDVAQHRIVDVVGDDTYGRKVIIVSACRLPSNKILDHNRLLR